MMEGSVSDIKCEECYRNLSVKNVRFGASLESDEQRSVFEIGVVCYSCSEVECESRSSLSKANHESIFMMQNKMLYSIKFNAEEEKRFHGVLSNERFLNELRRAFCTIEFEVPEDGFEVPLDEQILQEAKKCFNTTEQELVGWANLLAQRRILLLYGLYYMKRESELFEVIKRMVVRCLRGESGYEALVDIKLFEKMGVRL